MFCERCVVFKVDIKTLLLLTLITPHRKFLQLVRRPFSSQSWTLFPYENNDEPISMSRNFFSDILLNLLSWFHTRWTHFFIGHFTGKVDGNVPVTALPVTSEKTARTLLVHKTVSYISLQWLLHETECCYSLTYEHRVWMPCGCRRGWGVA